MNHLIILDAQAGELEKILSGLKSMLVKEFDPAAPAQPVNPGDSLYFLRNSDDCTLRVKATVLRVLSFANPPDEDLPRTLKELQPKLQLTENQFNYWSVKKDVLLVEFDSARKMDAVQVAAGKLTAGTNWIVFEELSSLTHQQTLSQNNPS